MLKLFKSKPSQFQVDAIASMQNLAERSNLLLDVQREQASKLDAVMEINALQAEKIEQLEQTVLTLGRGLAQSSLSSTSSVKPKRKRRK